MIYAMIFISLLMILKIFLIDLFDQELVEGKITFLIETILILDMNQF